MQFRNWQKSPSRTRFSEPETYRNSVKLGGRFLDDPRGLATYLKRPRGTPRAPQVAALAPQVAAPPCAQTLAAPLLPPPISPTVLTAKPCRRSPPPPPPRRHAVGIPRRIYYIRCPLERGEGRLHQHQTCDRVRRCCPIVAPSRSSTRFCKRQVIDYINNKI